MKSNKPASVVLALTNKTRIGYGFADFGFNLYYTGLNLFLLYYYTDVLEIRPAVAGLIFGLPLIWDAITDPIMGVIASRTRSRYGSYRPYLIYGSVPLAISFVMMFAAPVMFQNHVILAAAISHVVFRTAYTVVSIPYSALSARIVSDSQERGMLAGVRMIFATLGGLFTVFATLELATYLGDSNLPAGFLGVSLIYATMATLIFTVTFLATAEQPIHTPTERFKFSQITAPLKHNKALWILIVAIVFGASGNAIFGKGLIYYIKYVAALDITITGALVALTGAVSLSVPFWIAVSRKLNKRSVWLIGSLITIAAQATLYLTPPGSEAIFFALIALLGIASGAFNVTFWSMLPDTVEYGEWKTGIRDEGIIFGVNQLALKTASGIGISLLGITLEMIHYQANQVQTPETLQAIPQLVILLPLGLTILSAVSIAYYPINKHIHGRLVRILEWRRARTFS